MSCSQKKYTSIDVAKLAGVSQATVSRAMNHPQSVPETTRQRILAAAQKLNYSPNAIARSLVSNKTNLIGVIVADFQNPFYSSFVYSISERFSAKGKKVLLFSGSENNIDAALTEALCFQVDGLLIASSSLSQQLEEKDIPTKIPVVVINRQGTSSNYCSIASDDIESGRMIADYFHKKGFTSFAYISGPNETPSTHQRRKGYLGRLQERGISDCIVESGNYTYQSGFHAMQRIIPQHKGVPLAVFCGNDMMALGAIDAVRDHPTLRIPQDIAIIGFDDIEESAWEAYQLTTMQMPIEEMIDTAFEYLNSYPSTDRKLAGLHLFPCRLIERQTT